MTESTLLTTEELAASLGVHPQTIRRWMKSDDPPPHYRPGGVVRFDLEEVREWSRADLPPAA